jgi:NAD(P)H-hydrate epimerase
VHIAAGGVACSGAALLATEAALRIGAGMVTLYAPEAALEVYAMAAPHAVIKRREADMAAALKHKTEYSQAWLIGPGVGVGGETRQKVQHILASRQPCVLDADALTSFTAAPAELFSLLHRGCLLTPHEGEFARLFGALEGSKAERAAMAARISGAVVLLKGAETVIATPEGQIFFQQRDIPHLATAGAGDVLAGLCAGLLAQGLSPEMAGCIAAWIHAEAAVGLGAGLIADDLPKYIPQLLLTMI